MAFSHWLNSAIDARVTLIAHSSRLHAPPSPPYTFVANVKTFNGPLRFEATSSNSTPFTPVQLTVANTDGNTDVYLDKKYEGTFNVQSKLGNVQVQKPYYPSSMDPLGQGRMRTYQTEQPAANQITGWVGWGKQPTYGQSMFQIQGQVMITTSLSPITLQLGSGS